MPTVEFIVKAAKAKQGAKEFSDAMKQAGDAARDAQGRFVKTRTALDQVGEVASKVEKRIGSLFGILGASASMYAGLRTLAQYEQVMLTLQGVTQTTAAELKKFDSAARSLGMTSQFSATSAAETMLTLARAGLDVNQSLAASPHVINLATAEMMEMSTAADIVIGTLAQFSLAADQASRVTDVMIASSNAANTSAAELGEAMKYAGSFAAALKISLEDTAAAAAVLSNNNIRGTMAGTNLRGVLAALIAPTTEAKHALASLGLTAEDVNVTTHTLADAMGKLKNMNAQQAESIFGRLNVAGALVLASQGEQMKAIAQANLEAAGAAQKLADVVNSSLINQFKVLMALTGEYILRLGDAGLTRVLHGLLGTIQDLLRVWLGITDKFATGAANAMAAAQAVETLTAAVATFMLMRASEHVNLLALAYRNLGFAVGQAWSLIAANPWAAATALAVGALVAMRQEMVTIGDTSATVGAWVSAIWGALIESLVDSWHYVTQEANYLWRDLGAIWNRGVSFIGAILDSITSQVPSVLGTMFTTVKTLAKSAANYVIAIMLTMWDEISKIATRASSAFKGMLGMASSDPSTRALGFSQVTLALSGAGLAEAGSSWSTHFGKDYVGAIQATVAAQGPIVKAQLAQVAAWFDDLLPTGMHPIDDFWARVTSRVNQSQYSLVGPPEPAGVVTGGGDIGVGSTDPSALQEQSRRFAELFSNLELEQQLLFKTNREREIAVRMREAEKLVTDLQIRDGDRYLAQYRRQLELLEETKQLRQIAEGTGDAFGSMFKKMITGAESAREAMLNLMQAIMDTVLQTAVATPIAQLITQGMMGLGGSLMGAFSSPAPGMPGTKLYGPPAPSAYGNMFDTGGLHHFANGGVFGHSLFGFGSGQVGELGEKGPEAVAPLGRDSKGRLGVHIVGGGGGGSKTIIQNINIRTDRPDEFRRMPRSDFRRIMAGMQEGM